MADTITKRVGRAGRGVGSGGAGRAAPTKASRVGHRGVTLAAFAIPSLLLLLLINLYPLVYAGFQSVHNGDLISVGDFVGLDNYMAVLKSPDFWNSAKFTLIFTICGVFGSWLLGLAVALLLRTKIPGGGILKVLLLMPWIVPVVVSATAWNFLVATPQSPLPVIASALGQPNVLFLADPVLAQITVCVFKIWISFPFMMIMISASLAAVDPNVYEAAAVDGATSWQAFTGITLPIISRSTYISWILMTIFCVNDFPTIFLLTQGGPVGATTSLAVLSYQTVFADMQTGPGVAIAFLMTLVLVVVSVILYRQIRKVEVE